MAQGLRGHPFPGSPGTKLQGGDETGCSKPCTPQGMCPLLPHWGMDFALFPLAVTELAAPELLFIPIQTQWGKAGSHTLHGVWDGCGCHPARLSGLPSGLLAVILVVFHRGYQIPAWVSAEPRYKKGMNLSKDTNYTVMKYGCGKGPDSAVLFTTI